MLYIKNVRQLDPAGQLVPVEILIHNGKIELLGSNLEKYIPTSQASYDIIDGQNNLITPGLIDLHVHFREPGFTDKETIETGSKAAARGGFTTVCAMPNLNPVPDNPTTLKEIIELNSTGAVIKVEQYATISKNLNSEVDLVDFKSLAQAGAVAFTNDGVGVQTAGLMYQAMQKAAELQIPIVAHTEDNSLLFGGVMHEGKRNKELGLPGMLSLTESTQIARDVLLAEATGCHYHVCHVSAKESLRVIRDAKKAGINVTCEVAPHHLLLCEDDVPFDNAHYKMNPPLRSKEDREALIASLLDGTIDCIATDHAPHTENEKQAGFLKAPFGITGSEIAFQLLYTEFVRTGIFTLKQLVDWLTIKPAELFKLKGGILNVGETANLAIFDLENAYTVNNEEFASKSVNTPFTGKTLYGETLFTIYEGQVVYRRK